MAMLSNGEVAQVVALVVSHIRADEDSNEEASANMAALIAMLMGYLTGFDLDRCDKGWDLVRKMIRDDAEHKEMITRLIHELAARTVVVVQHVGDEKV